MIDHLFGRPSPSWKRAQTILVILFWTWRIVNGNRGPPRMLFLRRMNRALARFSPWQLIVSTLTAVYAVRNMDKVLDLGSPEPLANLYSPSYYRATWINTGLDVGFATAMNIRPKWIRDIASVLFSVYYIIYATEADEKLRRFRAVPTVEMLRTTWEKTSSNPYASLRFLAMMPRIAIRRKILLPRCKCSSYTRPITAWLFFGNQTDLALATDLILDFPGGGFVAMSPLDHEERLRMWARSTGKPILSIDYGKAPEYPYPYAIDEAFDVYQILMESPALIGMPVLRNIIMTGDSAGATMAVNAVFKILEYNSLHPKSPMPEPLSLLLNYPALDFNFTSWMTSANLRVLQIEQSTSSANLSALNEMAVHKDHLQHVSPLSMVGRPGITQKGKLKRRSSWKEAFRGLAPADNTKSASLSAASSSSTIRAWSRGSLNNRRGWLKMEDQGAMADAESDEDDSDSAPDDFKALKEEDRPIQARVRFAYDSHKPKPVVHRTQSYVDKEQHELSVAVEAANTLATMSVGGKNRENRHKGEAIGTRLTMTSRTGYFQDRVINPAMMRAMAIIYVGPHRNPDFQNDFRLSPILAPPELLARFPPISLFCGEKDPFVDDTVIFAGRIREAKRARKAELDLTLAGKTSRLSEHLRMSSSSSSTSLESMMRERDKLKSTEDDWVRTVIFPDWSHGYLQMPALMSEAREVIDELADLICLAFDRLGHGRTEPVDSVPSPFTSETETDDAGITFLSRRPVRNSVIPRTPGRSPTKAEATDPLSLADSTGSPPRVATPSKTTTTPRQTITETELMRRRRLLDSHIFE